MCGGMQPALLCLIGELSVSEVIAAMCKGFLAIKVHI